ncbi:hypothetical protein BH09ACT10_BH09ACT10_26710 [soil metagenome]
MSLQRQLSRYYEASPVGLRSLTSFAKTSSLLYVAGAVMLILSALANDDTRSPTWLLLSLAALSGAFALAIVLMGDRFNRTVATGMIVCNEIGIVILCLATNSALGMVSNGTVYVVISIYLVWFFPRLTARLLLACGLVSYLVVVLYRGLPGVPFVAVSTIVQCVIAAEVMLRVRGRAEVLATTDPLTGTLNRRAISDVAAIELARFERQGRPFSLLSIDLDGLKELNDSQGHLAGDEMLKRVARTWTQHIGPADKLARIGGDEFVILLPGRTQSDAKRLVERLRFDAPIGWSAGVAWVKPGDTLEAMLARADERLYRQKAEHREGQDG